MMMYVALLTCIKVTYLVTVGHIDPLSGTAGIFFGVGGGDFCPYVGIWKPSKHECWIPRHSEGSKVSGG